MENEKKKEWLDEVNNRCELAEYYTELTGTYVSYGQISLFIEHNIRTF